MFMQVLLVKPLKPEISGGCHHFLSDQGYRATQEPVV
jgi:hypothetical protein